MAGEVILLHTLKFRLKTLYFIVIFSNHGNNEEVELLRYMCVPSSMSNSFWAAISSLIKSGLCFKGDLVHYIPDSWKFWVGRGHFHGEMTCGFCTMGLAAVSVSYCEELCLRMLEIKKIIIIKVLWICVELFKSKCIN